MVVFAHGKTPKDPKTRDFYVKADARLLKKEELPDLKHEFDPEFPGLIKLSKALKRHFRLPAYLWKDITPKANSSGITM